MTELYRPKLKSTLSRMKAFVTIAVFHMDPNNLFVIGLVKKEACNHVRMNWPNPIKKNSFRL